MGALGCASDPDSLYAEFEVIDNSGYVLRFGRSL
jgi:hypothetical protein